MYIYSLGKYEYVCYTQVTSLSEKYLHYDI